MSERPIPPQRHTQHDIFTTAESVTRERGLDPLADRLGDLAARLEQRANDNVADARRAGLSPDVVSRMEQSRRTHFQQMEALKHPNESVDFTRLDNE